MITSPSGEIDGDRAAHSQLPRRVLEAFEQAGIPYVLLKGGAHLRRALDADSDVDVLVDGLRHPDVCRVFGEHNCRRAQAANARSEVGIEDFMAFDPDSGRLVHFHLHWRLVAGERHLKRYRLPWERFVLESRTRDPESGIFVTDPHAEAALALVHAAVDLRWRDAVRRAVQRSGWHDLEAELMSVGAHDDPLAVVAIGHRWLGVEGARRIREILVTGPSWLRIWSLRRVCRHVLATQRSSGNAAAVVTRARREAAWFQRGVGRYVRQRPVLHGRAGGSGGMLVAIIGADGSGKSTLVRTLRASFAPKFDTMFVYFGSGDGPSSIVRYPLKLARRAILGTKTQVDRAATVERQHSRAIGGARVVWALVLAYEKGRKLRRAMRARTRGLLVVCDRYPQAQVPGTTDGPMLADWQLSPSSLRRRLAGWEARPYQLAEQYPPDLVIRLETDAATAQSRRGGVSTEYVERRIDVIHRLRFPGARFGEVVLDASEPRELVLRRAVGATFDRM